MAQAKLLLDTNIVVDYLDGRDFDFAATRLLMTAGKVGEFSLWISSSQVTDLVYILSEGGSKELIGSVLERLRRLRSFVNVYAASASDVDAMLATSWADPEDELLFEIAMKLHADAIITRNEADFETELIKVCNSSEFFDWFEATRGLSYAEVDV